MDPWRCHWTPDTRFQSSPLRAHVQDPVRILVTGLVEEVAGRDTATRRTRRQAAGFPSGKTFDSWREADSSIAGPTQSALRTLEWVGRAENLAVTGPSGTGKSHFVKPWDTPSSMLACG